MKMWKSRHIFFTCILWIISVLFSTNAIGQISLERQVIGSSGNDFQNLSGLAVSYTVGEAVVNTFEANPYFFTQGFQQPIGMLLGPLSYININKETICPDVNLGTITVNSIKGCLGPYVVRLRVLNNGVFETVDSIPDKLENEEVEFTNLGVDTFIVEVIGATYCVESDTILLEAKNSEGCELKVYSGITPNGDGSNDIWIIDNIEIYGDNEVSIFNRWGSEVWTAKNYNNSDVAWDGSNKNGNDLPDATYFYVIKTDAETVNGWVELTR